MKLSGIYIKDAWVLKLANKLFNISTNILLFAFIVAVVSLGLYVFLTWLAENVLP